MISLSLWTDLGALCTSCAFILTAAFLYQQWAAKKSKRESKNSLLRRTLTPIGKFALLSQTERNPSIISFFIALASKNDKGMTTQEFEQLWAEVLKRHERFRYHVSEENNHPDLLAENFDELVGSVDSLVFATQDEGAGWQSPSGVGSLVSPEAVQLV